MPDSKQSSFLHKIRAKLTGKSLSKVSNKGQVDTSNQRVSDCADYQPIARPVHVLGPQRRERKLATVVRPDPEEIQKAVAKAVREHYRRYSAPLFRIEEEDDPNCEQEDIFL